MNEIRSISLDPDISIQPFEDYISIRGVVELNGEYEKNSFSEEDFPAEPLIYEDPSQSLRYVEKVRDADEGLSTFHHRFPVEISVPSYRVNNLEDVTVSISSFDYQLPEPSQLKLLSTIEIHGIDEEVIDTSNATENREAVEEAVQARESEEIDQSANDRDIKDSFSFEVKKRLDENEVQELEMNDLPEENLVQGEPELELKKDEETPSENKKENTDEEERWKKTHSQTLSEFFDSKKEQSILSDESNKQDNSPELPDTDKAEKNTLDSSNDQVEDPDGRDPDSNEDDVLPLRYLSELFRDEEEQFTKMRLYIVQDEDTISTIADRYETTKMHIIKQNSLDDEVVTQGQLLYVPQKTKE